MDQVLWKNSYGPLGIPRVDDEDDRMRLKIYLASPYGFSEAGRHFLSSVLIPRLKRARIDLLDPWSGIYGKHADLLRQKAMSRNLNQALRLAFANIEMIRKADMIIAVLDGPDVDSGVAAEIGFAYGLGKVIHGYRGDYRKSGDSRQCLVNLQVEAFIRGANGGIYTDLQALLSAIAKAGAAK